MYIHLFFRVDYDTQLLKKNRNGKKQLMTLKRKLQGLKQINNEEQIAWAKTK
jgi:hypothetical protein